MREWWLALGLAVGLTVVPGCEGKSKEDPKKKEVSVKTYKCK